MKAYLILEDGTTYVGTAIGACKEVISEIVFQTAMTGYQEVLSDPSYAGQAIVMTYPLIGNYGVSHTDMESRKPWADAFLVRELAREPSSWRRDNTLENFLKEYHIPGIAGLDTRSLTKHLRRNGTMNGCVTTKHYEGFEKRELLERIRAYRVCDVVQRVSVKEPVFSPSGSRNGKKVALIDLGTKRNIIHSLEKRGCTVCIYPADTAANEILAARPDGIMLSNGPGDPAENIDIIREIRKLYESDIPIFAICLGHQLMALATGAKTFKLTYGHRGGNHPVKDLSTGKVYISAQNHGYAVDAKTLDPAVAVESFRNVNDGTNEGLHYLGKRIRTVQFHPEARPGPTDTDYLFDEFMEMMEGRHA